MYWNDNYTFPQFLDETIESVSGAGGDAAGTSVVAKRDKAEADSDPPQMSELLFKRLTRRAVAEMEKASAASPESVMSLFQPDIFGVLNYTCPCIFTYWNQFYQPLERSE